MNATFYVETMVRHQEREAAEAAELQLCIDERAVEQVASTRPRGSARGALRRRRNRLQAA